MSTSRAAEALALDQIEQVALVRGAALDDQLEVGQRSREPRARGVARVADPDHLRDQRIEIGRDVAAGRDAAVDPHARPEHGIEARDPPGRGQEVRLRILRAHARLDRAAAGGRRLRGQRLAAPDPDLELDQVRAGELLGEPVLDLEARIHLEKRGDAVADEELDRSHADVADARDEPHGGVHELALRAPDRGPAAAPPR